MFHLGFFLKTNFIHLNNGHLQKVEAASLTTANLTQGNFVSFGGYTWKVLNSSKLLVTANILPSKMRWNDPTASSGLDWNTSELRAYLNSTFLNSLGSKDKSYITGSVTLLNSTEYSSTYKSSILSLGVSEEWTSTYAGNYGSPSYNAYFFTLGGGGTIINDNQGRISGVRPAVTLRQDLYITGGDGSQSNPYTISDNTPPSIAIVTADNQTLFEATRLVSS